MAEQMLSHLKLSLTLRLGKKAHEQKTRVHELSTQQIANLKQLTETKKINFVLRNLLYFQ